MRVNLYREELTDEVSLVTTTANTGKQYIGVRVWLKSPDSLHHNPDDDDRSAVTFWWGTTDKAIAYFSELLRQLKSEAERIDK